MLVYDSIFTVSHAAVMQDKSAISIAKLIEQTKSKTKYQQ